jgi:hypothetical protein
VAPEQLGLPEAGAADVQAIHAGVAVDADAVLDLGAPDRLAAAVAGVVVAEAAQELARPRPRQLPGVEACADAIDDALSVPL